MSDTHKYFFIDGEYEDIVYEVKNEICAICSTDGIVDNEKVLELNAQIISDVLILMNSDIHDITEYRRGFFSPHKRYYVKVDAGLVFALAAFFHKVIKLIQKVESPERSIMDEVGEGISVFCGFDTLKKKVLTMIKEEDFCILLCAHQKKPGEYISIHQVYKLLCDSGCPYSKLFEVAYGHSCTCLHQTGKCARSMEEIKEILDNLDPKFDVLKFKNDLYQIT